MKKLLFVSLFFIANVNSDIDLGEDFAPGDLVTADAFNTKFNALNGVVGEIVDADLLGNWECVSYMYRLGFLPDSYLIANVGNGQVGNGYFYSINATLNLSETDNESSINSPKSWTISKDGVVNFNGFLSGDYTLIGNTIFFQGPEIEPDDYRLQDPKFLINRMSASKLSLVGGDYPSQIIVCELTSS